MDDELEYEENIETITLDYEDGTSEELEVVGIFEHEGNSYIALIPLESEDEDDEDDLFVDIYACTEDEDGALTIYEIEDDELFDAVADTFDALLGDTLTSNDD